MTKPGFMPGALDREIPPGANDPEIIPCGVDLHVAVSRSPSLHDFFDGPSGGIESHFYVRFDGTIEQYRSIFREADAQMEGNSFMLHGHRVGFVSVETEGMGAGKWTAAQIASIKAIILFTRENSGVPHVFLPFPLEPPAHWNSRGVGYHSMFAEWNPNAHSCPGPARIRQYEDILVPWMTVALHHEKPALDSRGENIDKAMHQLKVASKRQPRHRAVLHKALDLLRSINPFTRRK